MKKADIQLRVVRCEDETAYLRHAREETLRALGGNLHPELIEPMPYAVYVLAYDTIGNRPIGMAEACFLEQHYEGYETLPYASVEGLRSLCAFSLLAGIRTVFVEPEFRVQHALYLKLILSQAYVFRTLGALYSTATTRANDEKLARLYDRTGGRRLGTYEFQVFGRDEVALYVFDLDQLLQHPLFPRARAAMHLDFDLIHTIRSRSRLSS